MVLMLSKKCLICKGGKKNDCLYWHKDTKTNDIWCWCSGICQRGYSLEYYCHMAGLSVADFLKNDFDFQEAKPNEVSAMNWPTSFIPLSDPRAKPGVEYIKSRGLNLDGDMYYDMEDEGIVLPYYFGSHFCGAQVRFINERLREDGTKWKITTLPGTRLGLLFGMWNQDSFITDIKAVVVCEGFFNALALQQAFNIRYGGISRNPWKFCSTSGSGLSDHQAETLKELKDRGIKVIGAADTDEAGFKMIKKMKDMECITHYAFTSDTDSDWNDLLQMHSHEILASEFLLAVKKI